jgi:hypothetical protein
MGGNDSSRTVEVTMGPPEGEVWVCNESRREIEEIKLSLLEKIVVFKDIPGDGAVRKTNINTDISGRFNLYIRIVFKGGEVKEYRTSFVRPKHVSGLYVGIDEKVDITFGR